MTIPSPNRILPNIIRISGGTATGHILTLIATPILTRFYAPAAFGEMALFQAIVSVLGVLVTLQYERSINVPEDDASALRLTQLALMIGAANIILLGIALVLFMQFSPVLWPGLKSIWYFIPIGSVGIVGLQVGSFWAIRMGEFRKLALARIFQPLTVISVQLLGIAFLPSGRFLIAGITAGWLCGGLILLSSIITRHRELKGEKLPGRMALARRYVNFARYSMPSMLLGAATREMPVFFLSAAFSKDIVGYYALANRLLIMPAALLGKAVAQSLLHTAKKEYHATGTVGQSSTFVLSLLISLSIIPFAVLALIAPEVFRFIFGAGWETAGIYLSILAPMTAIGFVTSPLGVLFSLLEKQPLEFRLNYILATAVTMALASAFLFSRATEVLALYSVVSSMGLCVVLWVIISISEAKWAVICSIGRSDLSLVVFLLAAIFLLGQFFPQGKMFIGAPLMVLVLVSPLMRIGRFFKGTFVCS
ncbi:hypothetical protein ES703_79708 [subsurface metagenome]